MSPTAADAMGPAEAEMALQRVREVGRIGDFGFGPFRRDCADLCRRVQLLSHLLDEIRDAKLSSSDAGSSSAAGLHGDAACLRALGVVLAAAKRVIFDARSTIETSPVELVRAQLRRATKRNGTVKLNLLEKINSDNN